MDREFLDKAERVLAFGSRRGKLFNVLRDHIYFDIYEYSGAIGVECGVLVGVGMMATESSDSIALAGRVLDDVYGGVNHDDEFSVAGRAQKISVRFGPKYPVAVVFAPQTRPVVCFEPMTGVTDAFNLNHAGLYADLQSVPPRGEWTESFWIRPSGF